MTKAAASRGGSSTISLSEGFAFEAFGAGFGTGAALAFAAADAFVVDFTVTCERVPWYTDFCHPSLEMAFPRAYVVAPLIAYASSSLSLAPPATMTKVLSSCPSSSLYQKVILLRI